MLKWYVAESADAENEDLEVDLEAVGGPGGASWASVSPDGPERTWVWIVFDRWLYEDATEIGRGVEPTQDLAKAAVERWVAAQG